MSDFYRIIRAQLFKQTRFFASGICSANAAAFSMVGLCNAAANNRNMLVTRANGSVATSGSIRFGIITEANWPATLGSANGTNKFAGAGNSLAQLRTAVPAVTPTYLNTFSNYIAAGNGDFTAIMNGCGILLPAGYGLWFQSSAFNISISGCFEFTEY